MPPSPAQRCPALCDSNHQEKFVACPSCGHGDDLTVVDHNDHSEHQHCTDELSAVYQCKCGLRGTLLIDIETREERVEGDLVHVADASIYDENSNRGRVDTT